MASVLVSGLVNIETTVAIDSFPLPYFPVRYPFHGIDSTVSGVGYNVAKALRVLGHDSRLLTLLGRDLGGQLARTQMAEDGLSSRWALPEMEQTAQSVILYEPSGRRQIHVDLKDNQGLAYPSQTFEEASLGAELLVLCNIGFSRPFLSMGARLGIPVATDVHALGELEDEYNRDFMEAADVLFMSHEHLPEAPRDWALRVLRRYEPEVLVIGLGRDGALLAQRSAQDVEHLPAIATRPVVNTIGAGDALFSAYLDGALRGLPPRDALARAQVFASYKIGARSASEGFLDEEALASWAGRTRPPGGG